MSDDRKCTCGMYSLGCDLPRDHSPTCPTYARELDRRARFRAAVAIGRDTDHPPLHRPREQLRRCKSCGGWNPIETSGCRYLCCAAYEPPEAP